jgi:hypothetical protein
MILTTLTFVGERTKYHGEYFLQLLTLQACLLKESHGLNAQANKCSAQIVESQSPLPSHRLLFSSSVESRIRIKGSMDSMGRKFLLMRTTPFQYHLDATSGSSLLEQKNL